MSTLELDIPAQPTVLVFGSTGDFYNRCQWDDRITDGLVAIIPAEGVVGIAGTWPVAVTVAHGQLHQVAAGLDPTVDLITEGHNGPHNWGKTCSEEVAQFAAQLAKDLGWALTPEFQRFAV